jgi:hypothetical protein
VSLKREWAESTKSAGFGDSGGQKGPEAGSEYIEIRTGTGLSYHVTPSKGLDISYASVGGIPISWQSPNGDVHPAYHDADSDGWLRTASGGLLMTCGLTQVGAPSDDQGQKLGLHGHAHHLPARQISAEGNWEGDEYLMRVAGKMEETRIFGEHLQLSRTISSRIGDNRIYITDVVENIGFQEVPHMLLYHFNFGFPLLGEDTIVKFPSRRVIARDREVEVEGFERWEDPVANIDEKVYYHEEMEDGTVTIYNPCFPSIKNDHTMPITVTLSWNLQQLPRLVQWKMPGEGIHVLGLEPANCYVEGRAAERRRGTLETLAPGESRKYELELEINFPQDGNK